MPDNVESFTVINKINNYASPCIYKKTISDNILDAWFPPFRCRSAVAFSPLPLRKFRKNSVSAVITLHT